MTTALRPLLAGSDLRSVRQSRLSTPGTIWTLICLGAGHMIVDATCGWLIARLATIPDTSPDFAPLLAITYSILAFAGQPFVGLLIDRYEAGRFAAALGCFLTACAVPAFALFPPASIILAGIGNALFHAGGGGISLRLTPGQAAAPGLFVAPGAIGLALGTMAGRTGAPLGWVFLLLPVVTGAAALSTRSATRCRPESECELALPINKAQIILGLLCLAIAVRSVTGLAMTSSWKSAPAILILLALAALAGKALAGVLADRFGWLRVTVPALLVAAPLASFGAQVAYLVVPGMVLVQVAMPVTVTAIGRLFPDRPSFAFGLASLALIIGAVPIFFGGGMIVGIPWISCSLQLLSVAGLVVGLRLLGRSPSFLTSR